MHRQCEHDRLINSLKTKWLTRNINYSDKLASLSSSSIISSASGFSTMGAHTLATTHTILIHSYQEIDNFNCRGSIGQPDDIE